MKLLWFNIVGILIYLRNICFLIFWLFFRMAILLIVWFWVVGNHVGYFFFSIILNDYIVFIMCKLLVNFFFYLCDLIYGNFSKKIKLKNLLLEWDKKFQIKEIRIENRNWRQILIILNILSFKKKCILFNYSLVNFI